MPQQIDGRCWLLENEAAIEPVIAEILAEIVRSIKKHGAWPEDIIHRAAIVGEESGELLRACVNLVYETDQTLFLNKVAAESEVYKEAIHTAAVAIKFILKLNRDVNV